MRRHPIARLCAALALGLVVHGPGRAELPGCEHDPCTRQELEAQERKVVRHLLRVQQARFETQARDEVEGMDAPSTRFVHLEREFKRTQGRWQETRQAITATDLD